MNPYVTVSEINQYITRLLEEDGTLRDFWLKGEISGFKMYQQSGHLYFTLKDDQSSISSVMFRSRARRLDFQPENGMEVLVRGSVAVFAPQGRYQLYVEEMQPFGVGGVYLFLEQLKEKLRQKGYFDPQKKKPLPPFARRIGIVTSEEGAALRDILRVLRQRHQGVEVILVHSAVQGAEAPAQLAQGIALLNLYQEVDVIIVGRGGGSWEDLMAFNSEAVVQAIYESEIPIISAVGHEVDTTLADLAADLRAATPTQAAQSAVADIARLNRDVDGLSQRLTRNLQKKLLRENERLDRLMMRKAWKQTYQTVDRYSRSLNETNLRLRRSVLEQTGRQNHRFMMALSGLDRLSPLKVMRRGYAMVKNDRGVLRSIDQVEAGDRLQVHVLDGVLQATVQEKEKRSRWNL